MTLYSPGVEVVEIDASAIVPSAGQPIAVFTGNFSRGPMFKQINVDTVEDFVTIYGEPTDSNFNDWFQIYNFLQYGSGQISINRIGGVDSGTGGLYKAIIFFLFLIIYIVKASEMS
jgi:hypothetical protein